MANAERRSAVRAGWSWLVDQAIDHWPSIVVTLLAGGGMGYLALVTDWVNAYGPIAWGGALLLSLLVIALAFLFYALGRVKLAQGSYLKKRAETTTVNTLAPAHERERISLTDFFNPWMHPTENVRFEHCDLFGPVNLVLVGSPMEHNHLSECEIVVIRPDRPIFGAVFFRGCLIVRCRLYRITLSMTIEGYRALPEDMRRKIPVISDGRVGDIQPDWGPAL